MTTPLRRSRTLRRVLTILASVALIAIPTAPAANAASYTQIEGSGSSWSKIMVDSWIADVAKFGMPVTYTGSGSSQGRKDFANSVTDFGISEIPYQGTDEFGNADTSNGRPYAYLPIVAGGTAFTYNLSVAGQRVNNLRLSGETIAKIFTGRITDWSDPAITKDNNGRKLPTQPITPVVRSDGSGTTAQFTTWLDAQYPSIWRPFFGRAGLTSYFPRKGRTIAASGSDQVMNTIAGKAGSGTIGYVEYSYALNKRFPVVKVLNRSGYFVEPTQYNTAVALTRAQINNQKSSPLYLTQKLGGVYTNPDPRAYPLSSYSYMIIPTGKTDRRMTTSKRQTLADFMFYSLCQGQVNAGAFGYSPLPLNLVQAGFQQLAKLKKADPGVDLDQRDATKCNNPTFVAGDLSRNHLAEIAPKPASCDKLGAGPCGTATGTGIPSTDANSKPVAGAGGKGGASGAGAATASGAAGAAAAGGASPSGGAGAVDAPAAGDPGTTVDPETGAVVSAAGTASAGQVTATAPYPTELVSARPSNTGFFGGLAALELMGLVLAPGLVSLYLRRRRAV